MSKRIRQWIDVWRIQNMGFSWRESWERVFIYGYTYHTLRDGFLRAASRLGIEPPEGF